MNNCYQRDMTRIDEVFYPRTNLGWVLKKQFERMQEEKMAFDFKKEYKTLYAPTAKPSVVDAPEMTFIMVDGKGDPNTSTEYKAAVEVLYGLSYGVKMSKMGGAQPEGYFDFVVPPLEGLWYSANGGVITDIADKAGFYWTSMIRQPDFVTPVVFENIKAAVAKKKTGLDLSLARLQKFSEGLCAQILHIGSYDDELRSTAVLEQFIAEFGYIADFTSQRRHHEIYLSDPRKTAPEKLKTIIRYPIMKIGTPELQFQSRNLFREWLRENFDTSGGIWLVFDKTKSGKSLSANDALEEALCFGWIDGQMKSIDETKYMKYFSRRRPDSPWSDKNKKLVEVLRDKGLMTDAGEDIVKNAVKNGQWDAARSEQPTDEHIELLTEKLRGISPAFENFCAMSPSVRKTYARRFLSFKSEEARERDFERIVDRLNKNMKPM
jgi:uncharacterized protein YdeI (YjbR/CyaY-like superfamily)